MLTTSPAERVLLLTGPVAASIAEELLLVDSQLTPPHNTTPRLNSGSQAPRIRAEFEGKAEVGGSEESIVVILKYR
jgi:hypothetical protein